MAVLHLGFGLGWTSHQLKITRTSIFRYLDYDCLDEWWPVQDVPRPSPNDHLKMGTNFPSPWTGWSGGKIGGWMNNDSWQVCLCPSCIHFGTIIQKWRSKGAFWTTKNTFFTTQESAVVKTAELLFSTHCLSITSTMIHLHLTSIWHGCNMFKFIRPNSAYGTWQCNTDGGPLTPSR